MEKDRQTKIIAIVALFIGVATLTLGFATFGANLIIQSRATVRPDSDSFKVVLSKEQDKETIGTVKSSGDGEEAIINNTGSPTISNLIAHFINPGEKVEYEFYAVNLGEFDAYLNKIEYDYVTGQTTNKVCTAGEETTDAYVQSACESIRVTVKVGDDDKACQTSTYGAHKLDKGQGEKIVVTLEYSSTGERADGPFNVEFGDITLNYSSTDSEVKDVPTCTDFDTQIVDIGPFYTRGRNNIEDNDRDGKISTSDKVTLGTESFYVMIADETTGTVTMLAEWNLNVGKNIEEGIEGIQNSACIGYASPGPTYNCTIAFSSTNYWDSEELIYPAFIYGESSNLYSHVENYVNKLKEAGYTSVTGSLIKKEELISLGCSDRGTRTCANAFPWVTNTTFWTGSANGYNTVFYVFRSGALGANNSANTSHFGVRPVITMNVSEI